MQDYEKTWSEFWENICTKDGELDLDQIKRELHDYKTLLNNVSEVYCHVTGDSISKPLANPKIVIEEADRHYSYIHQDK